MNTDVEDKLPTELTKTELMYRIWLLEGRLHGDNFPVWLIATTFCVIGLFLGWLLF